MLLYSHLAADQSKKTVPQEGHGTPLTHMARHMAQPLLATLDESNCLKIWQINEVIEDSPELMNVFLSGAQQKMAWSKHSEEPTLYCLDTSGFLSAHIFDLDQLTSKMLFQTHCDVEWAFDFCETAEQIYVASTAGVHIYNKQTQQFTDATPIVGLEQAQQAQFTRDLDLVVLGESAWQYFKKEADTWQKTLGYDISNPEPFTPETPFLLSGQTLVIERTVYFIQPDGVLAQQYYGRPLAFSEGNTAHDLTLLWASGDTLFTVEATPRGEILEHQVFAYPGRYVGWPVYWSFAVADAKGHFWIADHHRCNASLLTRDIDFVGALQGEGGWVESLAFTSENSLLLGAGHSGTLCLLDLSEMPALAQHYSYPAQPVEQLHVGENPSVFGAQSASSLSVYDIEQAQIIPLPLPPKPWHKALDNGALQQLSMTASGLWAQLEHKGKNTLQYCKKQPDFASGTWQNLQALPADAIFIQALETEQSTLLLVDHPTRTGNYKMLDPHTGDWQDFDCDLEDIDFVRWEPQQKLLGVVFENELMIWQCQKKEQSEWVLLHHLYQDPAFLDLRFGDGTPDLWTLDNDGKFKHFKLATEQGPIDALHNESLNTLQQWETRFEDCVAAIAPNGRYVALGAADIPLHIWSGETSGLVCRAMVSGTELAVW